MSLRAHVSRVSLFSVGEKGLVRNDVVHWIIIVAVIVLLAIAATVTAAAIILCARQGGVLDYVVAIDEFRVEVGCKRI